MTRVRSQGSIKCQFNVISRDMKKLGYDVTPSTLTAPSAIATIPNSSAPGAAASAVPSANKPEDKSWQRTHPRKIFFTFVLCCIQGEICPTPGEGKDNHDIFHEVTEDTTKKKLWLYVVKAQTSLAPLSWFHGSRVPTAHVHQCCIFQELCEDCAIANEIYYEIDYAWTCIHDNGHVITACDVWL